RLRPNQQRAVIVRIWLDPVPSRAQRLRVPLRLVDAAGRAVHGRGEGVRRAGVVVEHESVAVPAWGAELGVATVAQDPLDLLGVVLAQCPQRPPVRAVPVLWLVVVHACLRGAVT